MKIKSVDDALTYLMEVLYYSEIKIRDELTHYRIHILDRELHKAVDELIRDCDDNMLKLERIFNYLMQEPVLQRSGVTDELLKETRHMLSLVKNSNLREIVVIGCIQNIHAVKLAQYRQAYLLATELDLDTIVDLVQQIVENENFSNNSLSDIYTHEFNKYRKATNL